MPETQNDKDSKDILNPVKDRNNLLNATANNASEIEKVLTELQIFLKTINSQDSNWVKLRQRLNSEHPSFLQKIEIAYVYYYINYIKKAWFRDEDTLKNKDLFKASMNKLKSYLSDENSRYFDYLMDESNTAESNSPFKNTKLVATFLRDLIETKKNTIGLGNSEINVEQMSIEDFFNAVKGIQGKKRRESIDQALDAKDPEFNVLGRLMDLIESLSAVEGIFNIDLSKNELPVVQHLANVPNESIRNKLKNLIEKYNNKIIDESTREDFYKDIAEALKDEKLERSKEESEKEINTSLEDKLALNIADYITGRISASEFQKRDQQIKSKEGVQQSLNELDND